MEFPNRRSLETVRNIPGIPGALLVAGVLAAALVAGIAASARAADAPGGGAATDAAREREHARIRAELAAVSRRVADQYINEQPPGGLRDRVVLIVGALYETGQMGDPDPVLAAHYYEQAARQGLPEAAAALAGIHNTGAESASGSIPRNPERARQLYETAAAAGSVPAMLALGIIYAEGMNVDPDPDKALQYLLQAGERGDDTALERLRPVMNRAREWEDARPGRKGKSGFPTSPRELRKGELIQEFIDRTFELDRLASHTLVEISNRIRVATQALRE